MEGLHCLQILRIAAKLIEHKIQSKNPVVCQIAFLTWRRSLPFKVLPAPSSIEQVLLIDLPERRDTISWGGSVSSSSKSLSSSTNAINFLLRSDMADDRVGTLTGADCCCKLLESADFKRSLSTVIGRDGGIFFDDVEADSAARRPECIENRWRRLWLALAAELAEEDREPMLCSEKSSEKHTSASLSSSLAGVPALIGGVNVSRPISRSLLKDRWERWPAWSISTETNRIEGNLLQRLHKRRTVVGGGNVAKSRRRRVIENRRRGTCCS